tara:strand:+ start:1709 stop:2326 length:618 start_codon:yes stop_codon:yes gene_type:complete
VLLLRAIAAILLILVSGCSSNLVSNDDDSATAVDDTDSTRYDTDLITWTDCSGRVGDHPCDFTFIDQHGNDWSLYDNIGSTIVIDFSTVWCVVCQRVAEHTQEYQDRYQDLGHDLIWVTVLIDDVNHDTVELNEIQNWADVYGITTAPVLAGNRSIIDLSAENGYPLSSWPTFIIISDEMITTHGLHGWNEATVIGWIEEVLGIQ